MKVIYLNQQQASVMAGQSSLGATLEPVPYGDGFILPLSVLTDPAHETKHVYLSGLPVIEYEAPVCDDC